MQYVISVPHWRPTTTNELLGAHWAKANKMKKADANMIWWQARQERIPTALKKRRVEIFVMQEPRKNKEGKYIGGGRLIDPDGILKSTLDALKRCRMIVDDSAKWCECSMPKIERGTPQVWGTRIVLEDIVE